MFSFYKKNKLVLLSVLLGLIIGLVSFLADPSFCINRIEYTYPSGLKQDLPNHLSVDTFFRFDDETYIRNYTTSIGDTLQRLSISCGEIKIQSDHELSSEKLDEIEQKLFTVEFELNPIKKLGKVYTFRKIYLGALSGLFVGIVLSLIFNKIQPNKQPKTTLT